MVVLVTGAAGFLGREVVRSLCRRGHEVLALDVIKPSVGPDPTARSVRTLAMNLCDSTGLVSACGGVNAVIHLAMRMQGDYDTIVNTALRGTERLIEAAHQAGVRRFVLASSLSVYDWNAADTVLNESSHLESRPDLRDAYTVAKLGQERIATEACRKFGIRLTMLRPAAAWGRGRDYPPVIGPRLGPVIVMIAPDRQLPLVHVDNCAEAFAATLDPHVAEEGTFNVIDHLDVTVRQFVHEYCRRSTRPGIAIPASYGVSAQCAAAIWRIAPARARARLPSFVAPARFAARYKPVRIEGARFRDAFGWRPPFDYTQCMDRTFGGGS